MLGIREMLRRQKGQAMAEFVVFSPVLVLIFIGIMYFGRGYYLKHKTYTAARYCAWFCARQGGDQYQTCVNTQRNIAFQGVLHDGGDGTAEDLELPQPYTGGDLPEDLGTVSSILATVSNATYYKASIKLYVPNVLKFMGNLKTAGSTHVVMGDCWTTMDPASFVSTTRSDNGASDTGGYASYP